MFGFRFNKTIGSYIHPEPHFLLLTQTGYNTNRCLILTGMVLECQPRGNNVWNPRADDIRVSGALSPGLEGVEPYFAPLPVRSNPRIVRLKRASQIPVDVAFCGKDHTKAYYIPALSHGLFISSVQFYRLEAFKQTYGRQSLISCICFRGFCAYTLYGRNAME